MLLWLLVGVLAALVMALARQVGTLHLRLGPRGALEVDEEGPPLGEAPEPAPAQDLRGLPVTVGGPGRGQLLLFVSPDCPICREVLPGIDAAARPVGLEPVVVADAAEADGRAISERVPAHVPVVTAPDIAEGYGVPGTPYAVVTDGMGVARAKGTVNNLEQLEGLVDTALRRAEAAVPEGELH